jgi:hypothetical protein
MRTSWWCLGLILGVLCASTVGAAKPKRQGFTGDLGLGASVTVVRETFRIAELSSSGVFTDDEVAEVNGHFGLAPLSISLGGFLSPHVAVIGRLAGTSYWTSSGTQLAHTFVGPAVEVWPIDRLYLSGGAGFSVWGPSAFASNTSRDPKVGFGLDFRVGAALINAEGNDFTVSLEVNPGFYGEDTLTGFGLVGAWKWY